jgi:membrane protein
MSRKHDVSDPTHIRLADWRRILVCAFHRMMEDNLGVLAGGIAFYAFLSIFPAIAGGLMVWGLFVDASVLQHDIQAIEDIAPPSLFQLLYDQMVRIAGQSTLDLRIGVIVTLLLALWSASRGVTALMQAMNMAYHEEEKRGLVRVNFIAIVFTLGGIGFVVLSLAAIAAVPPILESLFLGAFLEALIRGVRWLLVIAMFLAASAMIYRFAPSRVHARWRWIVPGAMLASLVWLIASLVFSIYLANFNAYNATFGSLGAVAALLMWFWISAYAICMGAELNSQLELFTTRDTTIGTPARRGQRGAYVADHVVEPVTKAELTKPQDGERLS